MIIQHNIAALNAHRQLGGNNTIVAKNLEKLSSGYRINRAGDDAAGLAISEKMRAQIKGLERASANAQDGISLVQSAEGALTEVHSMLNRMVELSTQSANGTYKDDVDRDALQSEVESLKSEIDRVAQSTNFNGINLIDGSLGSSTAHKVAVDVKYESLSAKPGVLALNAATSTKSEVAAAGTASTMTVGNKYTLELKFQDSNGTLQNKSIEFTAANAATNDAGNNAVLTKALQDAVGDEYTATVVEGKVTVTAKNEGADNKLQIFNIGVKDTLGDDVANAFGAITNTAGTDAFYTLDSAALKSYDGSDTVKAEDYIFEINGEKFAFVANDTAATKLGADVNYIKTAAAAPANTEVASMVKLINEKTGIKAAVNATDTKIDLKAGVLAAGKGNGLELQVGDTNDKFNKVSVSVEDMSSRGLGISGVDIGSKEGAGKAQDIIKAAINKVSTNRGNLGALQNRLEHTINNLGVTTENMTAAESRVRDVDMAKEMMAFTKNNVLTQAAQAMLAQANQQSQGVLQLLR